MKKITAFLLSCLMFTGCTPPPSTLQSNVSENSFETVQIWNVEHMFVVYGYRDGQKVATFADDQSKLTLVDVDTLPKGKIHYQMWVKENSYILEY